MWVSCCDWDTYVKVGNRRMKIGICIDCGKKISKNSIRCKSCSNKNRRSKYKISELAKENIGNSLKGKIPWNKGKNHKIDNRIKIKPLEELSAKKYGVRQEEWIKFSKKLRKKIGFCKICKKKLDYKKLDIHHINPYESSKDNSIKNLLIVCKSCHSKIHYYNKENLWNINNG